MHDTFLNKNSFIKECVAQLESCPKYVLNKKKASEAFSVIIFLKKKNTHEKVWKNIHQNVNNSYFTFG